MRYAIIHCYSDRNRGDAGIIVSTTDMLRALDPDANIDFHSTYGARDPRYVSEHRYLRRHPDRLLPALFPDLFLRIGRHCCYYWACKTVAFAKYAARGALLLLLPRARWVARILLNREERAALSSLSVADIVVSKGGSFLCADGSARQSLQLMRMLFPLVLARRLEIPTVILGQSLGPVEGRMARWMFNRTIPHVDLVYLRERLCERYLQAAGTRLDPARVEDIPDLAFALNPTNAPDGIVPAPEPGAVHLGLTLVNDRLQTSDVRNNYTRCVTRIVERAIKSWNAHVFVFPQVTYEDPDGTADHRVVTEMLSQVAPSYRDRIQVVTEDLTPGQLKSLYARMDVFLASRLHSGIFAMGGHVPTVNVAYHGSKSQGIMRGIGMADYVLDIGSLREEELWSALADLRSRRQPLQRALKRAVDRHTATIRHQCRDMMTRATSSRSPNRT